MNTNNLWFLAIFFAMSFGSWLLGQLREQAKLKKARDEAKQRYEEQLRTGRSEASRPAPVAPGAAVPPNDLAEKRQAQLRELRKQQESSRSGGPVVVARPVGTGTPGPSRPAPTPIVLGPGGIVIQRAPMPPRPRPVQTRPEPVDPAAMMRAADQAERALEQKKHREKIERRAASDREEKATAAATATRRAGGSVEIRGLLTGIDGRQARGQELRRLIALSEILGKPVSLRGPETSEPA